MANLLIAYDLNQPGQNYEAVTSAICSLGNWYKLQYSLFYVQSELSAEQAYDFVRVFMDHNDKLMVTHAESMVFGNYAGTDIFAVQNAWNRAA